MTITPENATDRKIEWSSSDPDVVEVDSEGMITGLKEGTATITASYMDEMSETAITATCVVTVTAAATDDDDSKTDNDDGKTDDDSKTDDGKTNENSNTNSGNNTENKPIQQPNPVTDSPEVTVPTVASIKSLKVTAKKKQLVISWKKAAGISGYQIQVSTKSNFKGAKTNSISKSKTKYTASKLKAKKKYYVRIRAYKTYKDAAGKSKKAYGKWAVKSQKTK